MVSVEAGHLQWVPGSAVAGHWSLQLGGPQIGSYPDHIGAQLWGPSPYSPRDLQVGPSGPSLGMTLSLPGVAGLGAGVSFPDARGDSPGTADCAQSLPLCFRRFLGPTVHNLLSPQCACSPSTGTSAVSVSGGFGQHGLLGPAHRLSPRRMNVPATCTDVCGCRSLLESVPLAGGKLSLV